MPVLWRLFWALAALQVADLATTYVIIGRGGREGNVFMRQVIHTPLAPVTKGFALLFLAALIFSSLERGRPGPRRLTLITWVILGIYVVTVLNNAGILLFP